MKGKTLNDYLNHLEQDVVIRILEIEYNNHETKIGARKYFTSNIDDMKFLQVIGDYEIKDATSYYQYPILVELKLKRIQPTYDDLKELFEDGENEIGSAYGKLIATNSGCGYCGEIVDKLYEGYICADCYIKRYYKEQEDVINKPNHYNLGTIETREYILDVLDNNKHLTAKDGYYLGNKGDKLEDMKKAKNYLDKWIGEYE